jgi:Zn-dependent M32 family carboxypeptidase
MLRLDPIPFFKAIVKAVKELADLRKNDRKAYEALIKKYEGRTVRIVPG